MVKAVPQTWALNMKTAALDLHELWTLHITGQFSDSKEIFLGVSCLQGPREKCIQTPSTIITQTSEELSAVCSACWASRKQLSL